MAVSNVRASPTSNNLHYSASLLMPRVTCARMLAVSHFAQQSAKNSHFRAISRRSHGQSSRASFGLWTRLPNL